jgi:hypothetical protein
MSYRRQSRCWLFRIVSALPSIVSRDGACCVRCRPATLSHEGLTVPIFEVGAAGLTKLDQSTLGAEQLWERRDLQAYLRAHLHEIDGAQDLLVTGPIPSGASTSLLSIAGGAS